MKLEHNPNSESRMMFILCVLGLIFGILVFGVILSNNILRERNLALNEYAIHNCNIVRTETVTEYKRP